MFISFYSKKNRQVEKISLQLTEQGWLMDHPCYRGEVDPPGTPFLLECFEENYAEYPPAFGDALEELWEAARSKQLEEPEMQNRFNAFSSWVMHYEITLQPAIVH